MGIRKCSRCGWQAVTAVFLLLGLSANAEEATNEIDGAVMVRVEAGSFLMGRKTGYDAYGDEANEHTVQLSEFWIYKYEVTNKQWLDFVTASNYPYRASLDLYGMNGSNQPVVGISWEDAAAYCRWAGVTLPTEAQWEYAARGPNANVWPWGNTFDSNCVAWAYGMSPPGTQDVGSHPDGASWCGALDMAGNAWEWCSDEYSKYYSHSEGAVDPVSQQPANSFPVRKHLRGGGWGSVGGWQGTGGYQMRGSYRYGAAFPAHRCIYNGFRCISGDASSLSIYEDTRTDPGKEAATYYTTEQLAHIRANIAAYPSLSDRLPIDGTATVSYLPTSASDDVAWGRLTGQDVPRAYPRSTWPMCPECGLASEENFQIVYEMDGCPRYEAWKMKCPSCNEKFPKNDFSAYYQSGLDEEGTFRAYLADRSLLYNEDHPHWADPLHYYAVDDGSGWIDENGQRHYWVARYNELRHNHFGGAFAGYLKGSLESENTTYMRRLAFLLYRLATLYPEYDWRESWKLGMFHSSGASGDGRIVGRIWENTTGLRSFAYDVVFDFIGEDSALLTMLQDQLPDDVEPESASDIRKYIEKYYIAEILDAYFGSYPGIRSNTGSNVRGLVTTAITLDDPVRTTNALATLFASGWLGAVFESYIDRDGAGYEGAPGYTFGWTEALHDTAQLLKRSKYSSEYGLYDRYPLVWEQMYLTPYYITALDRFTPRVEDHGTCGAAGMTSVELDMYLDAFELLTNSAYAQIAYVASGTDYDSMYGSVLSENPTAIRDDVRDVIEGEGPISLESTVRDGYGMAMLRSGAGNDRRGAFLYFGRQGHAGHGQYDSLNIGLYYNGMSVAPDMGYPEYTVGDAKSDLWTRNTIAHNLVTVNRSRQSARWIGTCNAFRQEPGLALLEVDASSVYSAASMYRRTLAMVDIDGEDSYYVDVFRVYGGSEHVYGFHGADGELTVTGVNLTEQEGGTYLGEEYDYGYGGLSGSASGYQWLHDVSVSSGTTGTFLADWAISDYFGYQRDAGQVHLRLTMLNECDDVAVATGHPAWSDPDDPGSSDYRPIRYLLARRYPSDGKSDFITVLEPTLGSNKLSQVQCLSNTNGHCAVRVVTTSGRTDTFVCATGTSCRVTSGDVELHGRWAFISESDDEEYSLFLMGGDFIQIGDISMSLDAAQITGSVVDRGNAEGSTSEGWFTTDTALNTNGALTGRQVCFDSSTTYSDGMGPRDGRFEVQGVTRVGEYSRVDLGNFRMTSGYIDSSDPDEGMRYIFNSDDIFEIPMTARLQRSGDTWELEATCDVRLSLGADIRSVEYQLADGSWHVAARQAGAFVIPCGNASEGAMTVRAEPRKGTLLLIR